MAVRLTGSRKTVSNEPPSAKELVDKYSGIGVQFKVKFVGSENINRSRGDAEAAKYCIPTLKVASQQSRVHKPKAALGLSLKGVSLYDEITKNITRVPLEKVTYISHDPTDMCYIGVIVSDKDSDTGFKLYCFKAEKPVAAAVVNSARELFELMYKLRQAKKKLKAEKLEAEKQTQNSNPEHSNLPTENAPPPSYHLVSDPPRDGNTGEGPPERPPPPRPVQPPPLPPRPEDEQDPFYFSLDPPPSSNPSAASTRSTTVTATPQDSLFSGFEDLNLNEPMVSIVQPIPNTTASGNPFTAQPQPFIPGPPNQQSMQFGGMPVEPSITMDLVDAINNPSAGTMSYNYPMGMGGAGMGMGGAGMGMSGAGMGMGGAGMGMGGAGMGMGGAGMGMSGMGMGNFGGNSGFGMPAGQPNPQTDIFSLPADPLINSGFSEPLLPTNQHPQNPQSNTGKGQQQQYDAFSGLSDLVSIAKTQVKSSPAAPPRYSVLYSGKPGESTDFGGSSSTTMAPVTETPLPPPASVPPPPASMPPPLASVPPPPASMPPPLSGNNAAGGGFDDFWGSDFGTTTSTPASQVPAQSPWESF